MIELENGCVVHITDASEVQAHRERPWSWLAMAPNCAVLGYGFEESRLDAERAGTECVRRLIEGS